MTSNVILWVPELRLFRFSIFSPKNPSLDEYQLNDVSSKFPSSKSNPSPSNKIFSPSSKIELCFGLVKFASGFFDKIFKDKSYLNIG